MYALLLCNSRINLLQYHSVSENQNMDQPIVLGGQPPSVVLIQNNRSYTCTMVLKHKFQKLQLGSITQSEVVGAWSCT